MSWFFANPVFKNPAIITLYVLNIFLFRAKINYVSGS